MSIEVRKNTNKDTCEEYPYEAVFIKNKDRKEVQMKGTCRIDTLIECYEEFLLNIADREDKEIDAI